MRQLSPKDTISRRVSLLQTIPLFTGLSLEALETLASDFRLKTYGKNEIILREGDRSRELYLILEGRVHISKISPDGDESLIAIYAANDLIGEFAALDAQPRAATAKAIVPTTLLAMTQDKFVHHLRTIPDLALSLARLLVNKLRGTAVYAELITHYDAAGRLLHILLLLNKQFGQEQEVGKRYVLDLSLNQTDLASLIGTRREWVNRILKDWRKRGLIEYHDGKIIILDLPSVEAERDSRIETNSNNW